MNPSEWISDKCSWSLGSGDIYSPFLDFNALYQKLSAASAENKLFCLKLNKIQ